MAEKFYNCHAHCFTYDHVPEHFLSEHLVTSWLLHRKFLKRLIHYAYVTGKLTPGVKLLLFFLKPLFGFKESMVLRYINFVKYGDQTSDKNGGASGQEKVIRSMQAYYPQNTGLVMLSMDLEYMGAGKPLKRFNSQLTELAQIKGNVDFADKVYPFIFCDPRRLKPVHKREIVVEQELIGDKFFAEVKRQLSNGTFQGIKIYPALGYHVFDVRMKQVYDFALENNIPIMTHCTIGAVHFKYELDHDERFHPFLKEYLPVLKPADFQKYFSHPLNFECLLNPAILKTHWKEEAANYSGLKICLGHWGNGDDWHKYLDDVWLETDYSVKSDWSSLELGNWVIKDSETYKNFSWFTIICDLMRKYPNVYADISYTLNDASLLPLLKMMLEADENIRKKVLFGTDFYLVSKASSERAFAINVRAELGEELFKQIAITNAKMFLTNAFSPV